MGNRNKYISGETPDEKFENVATMLQRLERKAGHKVTGILPPIPLFSYTKCAEDDGTFFRFLSPFSGTVKNICFQVDKTVDAEGKKISTVEVNIEILSPDGHGSFYKMNANTQKMMQQDVLFGVVKGARITMKVAPANVEGLWVAATLALDMSAYTAKDFMFEEAFGGANAGI